MARSPRRLQVEERWSQPPGSPTTYAEPAGSDESDESVEPVASQAIEPYHVPRGDVPDGVRLTLNHGTSMWVLGATFVTIALAWIAFAIWANGDTPTWAFSIMFAIVFAIGALPMLLLAMNPTRIDVTGESLRVTRFRADDVALSFRDLDALQVVEGPSTQTIKAAVLRWRMKPGRDAPAGWTTTGGWYEIPLGTNLDLAELRRVLEQFRPPNFYVRSTTEGSGTIVKAPLERG